MQKFNLDNIEQQTIILDWWTGLKNHKYEKKQLIRAKKLIEIMSVSYIHGLFRNFQRLEVRVNFEKLAFVAAVLVLVIRDTPEPVGASVAKVFGINRTGEVRFRRLLQSDRREFSQCLDNWRRVVKRCKGNVSVIELTKSLYWLNEISKRNLAVSFYQHLDSNGE